MLQQAVDAGLNPVLHVSGYAALELSDQQLTTQSPTRQSGHGYAPSKGATDRMARQLQDAGAPVVIAYPGAVLGPHDPYLGDSNSLVRLLATSRRPPAVGMIACVDVRDVAAVHATLMAHGAGPLASWPP